MSWSTPAAPTGFAIVAIGPLPPEATAAIAALGGRVIATIGWDAIEELAIDYPRPLVVASVPSDTGHGPLEHLATILDEAGLDALVTFDAPDLDAVAAVLMTPRTTLLCEATPSDWATALAVASHRANAVPAGVRESDSERLRRLNDEIARIAALLAGLVDTPEADTGVADRRARFAIEPTADVAIDPADVRRTIRARRLRAHYIDPRLVEDPGWDMLLDLFAAELERTQVSVSSLCIAAAVAPTTALRWITRMVDAGLFVRIRDTGDGRRAFMTLSAQASAAMCGYFAAARRAGLQIA